LLYWIGINLDIEELKRAEEQRKTAEEKIREHLNLLKRLNREAGMNFNPSLFRHLTRSNAVESRIEMHLESLVQQEVMVPAGLDGMELRIRFNKGETIHTENSYKFSSAKIDEMLTAAGFSVMKVWTDPLQTFAVTLSTVGLS
jgi:L-histidine Nalpha-methyltransferase